jgi:hypothetical protein
MRISEVDGSRRNHKTKEDSMGSVRRLVLFWIVAGAVPVGAALAQTSAGTITGTVKDSAGSSSRVPA